MVRDAKYGALSLLVYLIAMGLHFVVGDHSLRERQLPEQTVLTLLGLVAGGVISNNTLMELTPEKKFLALFCRRNGICAAAGPDLNTGARCAPLGTIERGFLRMCLRL
jgi:hypothetical protein